MEHSIKDIESVNVQQPEGLTGQVNNQVQAVHDIVSEAVNQKTEREQRLELLEGLRISSQTEVEEERYALSVDGVGFFALGDLHLVKGKAKSGKSAVLKVCLAALMAGRQFRVVSELRGAKALVADTEQQASDVRYIIDEVKRMANVDDDYIDSHLFVYTLRRRSTDQLLDDTRLLIEEHRPDVAFIDGLADYVASFNNEELSRQLIGELMKLCDQYCCAIVCCMHENKAVEDKNPKGHLGSISKQKSGTVLSCTKQSSGDINVSCSEARHGVMPPWNIGFDEEGHIVDADEQFRQQQEELKQVHAENNLAKAKALILERVGIMQDILREAGGYLTRSELKNRLMEKTNLKNSRVYELINSSLGTNIVEKNGYICLPDEPDLFT